MTKKSEVKAQDKMSAILKWFVLMLGYIFVFATTTKIFHNIHINSNHKLLVDSIIVIIVYFLNKTIKPILVKLTIPITALTLGLFYPLINVFILKLADWLMGNYFNLTNIFVTFFLAIYLSIMNIIVEWFIKRILKRVKFDE